MSRTPAAAALLGSKAVTHVDVGAGGIRGRFTQDRQSQRCPSRRRGACELADAADWQTPAQQGFYRLHLQLEEALVLARPGATRRRESATRGCSRSPASIPHFGIASPLRFRLFFSAADLEYSHL